MTRTRSGLVSPVCSTRGCGTVLSAARRHDGTCYRHGTTRSALAAFLPEWATKAACAGKALTERFDVELPSDGSMTNPVLWAKRKCFGCPVRRQCLAYGFALDEQVLLVRGDVVIPGEERRFRDVVFGGLTGRERMAIADTRGRVRRGLAKLNQQAKDFHGLRPVSDIEAEGGAA